MCLYFPKFYQQGKKQYEKIYYINEVWYFQHFINFFRFDPIVFVFFAVFSSSISIKFKYVAINIKEMPTKTNIMLDILLCP